MIDSRIDNAIADTKAAIACLDDARSSLYELLTETSHQIRDEHRIVLARKCLNDALVVSGRAVEYLQRLGDQTA